MKVRRGPIPEKPNKVELRKIISGGQIGADIAALDAALEFSPMLETGGHMPCGFMTLSGKMEYYQQLYGVIDDSPCINGRPDYAARTYKNVQEADATLRLATDFFSNGERCTLDAIRYFKKPHLDIFMKDSWIIEGETQYRISPYETAHWIVKNHIQVLNIAGNASLTLEPLIYEYLIDVFNFLFWE
jgi:hypothetical protein